MLLAAGADANSSLPEGETVLMAAAKTGNPDVVGLLLSGGADADGALPAGEAQAFNAADPNAKESWHGPDRPDVGRGGRPCRDHAAADSRGRLPG